ncbi:cadherin-99C-like [Mercenaria mercenaria]|uniref:cadherin-99C-like n=1 Tax=Mercenaria mercenaria TaxID=6596 RepID=UPI00234F64CD|nr:cadherin-99C-like [Mercenaria mercenaria]
MYRRNTCFMKKDMCTFHLKLNSRHDFFLQYEVDITTITLTVTYRGNTVDVFISVTPVNEFAPVFINNPYNITLPESTRVGTVVYKLKPKVQDKDVGGVHDFYFQIHPYSLNDYDGSAFFSIPASSTGNITLTKPLDFDTMAKNTRFLNLSVADGQSADSKTNQTTLQVNIYDADDQVPYFEYPNCPAPCPAPAFVSVTHLAYTGPLEITPPLKGKDDDTLGTYLLYSIKIGNKNNLFTMDQSTGGITLRTSVAAANLPDTEFRLVIEVRKNLQNIDLSSVAVLNVKVWERWQNDNNYQGNESTCDNDKVHQGNESTSDNDKEYQGNESTSDHSSGQNDVSAYKTAVIILAVALAIVTTVLFVVIVMYMFLRRTKQHTDTELHSNYQDLSPHHLRNGGVYS